MNWLALDAIATATTGFIIFFSVVLLGWQIRELRRATNAEAFSKVITTFQEGSVRMAMGQLSNLGDKDLVEWTQDEVNAAEKVCNTYDSVAIMVRNGMYPKHILVQYWRVSLIFCWDIASVLVDKYRLERDDFRLWEDFEWLAVEAKKSKRG